MADSDGSVVFEVEAKTSKAEKEIEKLSKKIEKTAETSEKKNGLTFNLNVSDVEKKLAGLNKGIEAVEKKLESSGDTASRKYRGLEVTLKRLKEEWNNIAGSSDEAFNIAMGRPASGIAKYTKNLGNVESTAKDAEEAVNELKKALEEAEKTISDLEGQGKWFGDEEYDQAVLKFDRLAQEANAYKKELLSPEKPKNPFGLDTIAGKLKEASLALDALKAQGKGLGDEDFDKAYRKFALLTAEAKEYQKQLTKAPADEMFQGMADRAAEAMKWIEQYREQLDDLEGRKAKLGLALGAKDEYAQIQSEIDSVTAHLGEMLTELDGLAQSGALGTLAGGAEIAEQRIAELSDELAELQERQANLGLAFGAKEEYGELSAEIERVNQLIEAYQQNLSPERQAENAEAERLQEIADSAEIANQRIVDLRNELSKLEERQGELESAGVGFGYREYDQNAARIAKISEQLGEYKNEVQGTTTMHERLNGVLSRMASLYETAGKAASNSLKTVGGAIATVVKKAAALNVFGKLTDGLTKKFSRLGQMIRRVFVFSMITSGLRAIRTQMGAYLSVNAEFSTALNRLKGVLLTAFQPIYDVVVPALTTLMNVLSRVIAAISQFTAVLFGTTAKQAQKNAQALYNQAEATAAAGSAAEEAAGSLAGFDEINTISTEGSSGGGGGGAAETGPLFDWEYEDTPFPDWGEAFDAFLDKILNVGIPMLKEAFSSFADWLNEFSGKLYDMFTFPGVKDKVILIGQELANAFNDLVNWINWNQLGQALGAGLNLALLLLVNFLYSFDWVNLGTKLAEFINGLASEIDWYAFGQLLWAGFKIALETLAGFILGLDMPALAEAASQVALGFFAEIKNTIEKIPWDEIGRQIARFLTNIKWDEIFKALQDIFDAALDAVADLLIGFLDEIGEQLDMHGITDPLIELVQTVHDFIQTLVEDTINWVNSLDLEPLSAAFQNLLEAISPLVSTILDGLLWAYENVLLPLGSWTLEEAAPKVVDLLASAIGFLSAALEKISPVLQFLWNSIIQPILGAAWDVLSVALETITNILQKLTDLLTGNTTFSDFVDSLAPGEAIILGVAAALGILGTAFAIGSAISVAGALISGAITAIGAALAFLASPIGIVIAVIAALAAGFTLLYQHFQPFRDFIDGIIEGAKNLLPGVAEGIQAGWDALTEFLSGIWNGIVDGFKAFFGIHSPSTVFAEQGDFLIQGLSQGISDTWHTITDFFGEKLDSLKQTLSDAWNSIKEKTSEVWTTIKDGLGEKWENIKSAASDAWGNLKSTISEGWESIKSNTSEKWGDIKSALGETWENIKSSASEAWGNLKSTISEGWGSISSNTSEKWQNIKSALGETWGNVKATAADSWENLKNTISSGWENISSNTGEKWEAIKTALGGTWDVIKEFASEKFEALGSAVSGIWDALKASTAEIWEGIFGGIKEILAGVIEFVTGVFTGDWETAWEGVFSIFKGIWNNVVATLESAVNFIINGVNALIAQLNKVKFDVPSWVPVIGGKSFGFSIPSISTISIPRLAQGAVIPPNREFMAVLGDQSHGNNLEAPESLIRQIVREESGGGNTELLQAILEAIKAGHVIMVDRRVLGKTVKNELNRMARQNGASVVLG